MHEPTLHLPPAPQIPQQQSLITNIQHKIFSHIFPTTSATTSASSSSYTRNSIKISQQQYSTSYYIKGKGKGQVTFYLGHGFGGSSFMYFHVLGDLLEKGDVVLWEIRGMGVGVKNLYPEIHDSLINQFYVEGLKKIIDFYKHKNIIFISHSLSAYITLRYQISNPSPCPQILQTILLSPVGITARQQDTNYRINSCGKIINALVHSFGWKFRLTFKSPLRTLLCCCWRKILTTQFHGLGFTQQEVGVMVDLFGTLISLPDGSQNLFFRYFLPRVLPRDGQSISQLITPTSITTPVTIYFGGKQDWADRQAAFNLSNNMSNFKMHILESGGHMICLHKNLMKSIIEQAVI